jgi:TldD protein
LDKHLLESAVRRGTELGASFCEARFFEEKSNNIVVENGVAKMLGSGTMSGIGIRVVVDKKWGFASTNVMTSAEVERTLSDAIEGARSITAEGVEEATVGDQKPVMDSVVHKAKMNPDSVDPEEKVRVLLRLDEVARTYNGRVKDTFTTYRDAVTTVVVHNSFGTYVEETTPRTYAYCRVISKEGSNMQTGIEYGGGVAGFEVVNRLQDEQFSKRAAEKAVKLLSARPPPTGTYTVVVDQRVGGLFIHEAFGHNCEADHVLGGQSIVADKMGQKVASDIVTIMDDPTMPKNGHFVYDHEGVKAEPHTIVRDGTLVGFLHSLESAAKMKAQPQGSARARSHQFPPIIRMSNTYLAPRDMSFEEILGGVKLGVYLTGMNSGYVETQKGQFTCKVEQGWLIERGELQDHLRDVSINGLTLDALKSITAVGKDFKMDSPGTCGKMGQGIPTDAGAPHFRIDGIVVGGRQ